MHIAIDVRMINASGIGRYIRSLLPLLSKLGNFSISLIGKLNDLAKYDCVHSKNIHLISCNAKIYSLREQYELIRKIPKKTNLFWSPHYNIPLFSMKTNKRLVTIHDVFHLAFFDRLTLIQKLYAKLILNSAANLSDKIITVSDFSKSEISKYIKVDENKITVIHNGINSTQFKLCNDADLNHAKKKYGLPDKFILYVGNIKPHKNLKRLLNAFEELYENGIKEYDLMIVGEKEKLITVDKEIFKILEDNINLKKKVLFKGYIENEDLSIFYNLASLHVFPSLYEGFGFPPLEAMACGCPVVVSNVASLPEVCGDAAYYVDPHDVESIAEGMYKVLTDEPLRQSLIKKGLERAKLFSWEKSAREHIKVFEEVLSEYRS